MLADYLPKSERDLARIVMNSNTVLIGIIDSLGLSNPARNSESNLKGRLPL